MGVGGYRRPCHRRSHAAEDFDGARFRVALLATNARAAGFANVALAATLLLEALGPDDSIPGGGRLRRDLAAGSGRSHGLRFPLRSEATFSIVSGTNDVVCALCSRFRAKCPHGSH